MKHYTIPATVALALALHLAGCDKAPRQPPDPAAATAPVPSSSLPSASIPSSPVPPASPLPSPSVDAMTMQLPGPAERDPIKAIAYWRQALEAHDWTAARSVFGDFGAASGQTPQAFAAAWSKYRIIDITVGPGEQDAGAGSSYYEAPVTITGLTTDDRPYHLAGRLTLRRVNDIDGATPEQLRWHIERSTLKP